MKLRWHWGVGIALVYGMFAVATTGFVVFAVGQKIELVSDDYYQRGLDYDGRMAAEANGRELGDAMRVQPGDAEPSVLITWAAARPRRGDGTVTLYRPSDAAADVTVEVDPDPSGSQRIPLDKAPRGRWVARVQWTSAGREYFVERNVTIP